MCHGKQPYLYLSYDQRKISSPVQINIFFDTVYLKSDIYTSNKPIFIILMIKGITVHLFKCIYLIIIIITKGVYLIYLNSHMYSFNRKEKKSICTEELYLKLNLLNLCSNCFNF